MTDITKEIVYFRYCGEVNTRAFFERQGFRDVGWNLGHLKWYLAVLLFCTLLWLGPPLAALPLGRLDLNPSLSREELIVVVLSLSGFSLVAGFGEEFGWRGYLLPRLLSDRRIARGALVMVGFVWGVWHCAVAAGPLLRAVLESSFVWPLTGGAALLGCAQATVFESVTVMILLAAWFIAYRWWGKYRRDRDPLESGACGKE